MAMKINVEEKKGGRRKPKKRWMEELPSHLFIPQNYYTDL